MKKIKILFIGDSGGWGGAQKIVLTLVKSLDRERYEPCFVLGSAGLFAQSLIAEGIPVQIAPMKPMSIPASKRRILPLLMLLFTWRLAWYTWEIYRIVRRVRPDLIQTCSIQTEIISSFVAGMTSVKLLWHVQTIQPPGFRRKLVRFLANRFPTMIVATSQAVADIYTGVVPLDKLQVNHAGLNLADFAGFDRALARNCLKMELGLAHQKIVVFASMLRPGKGAHVFIQAAGEVLKHISEVVFLVVGEAQFDKDYEYKSQLITMINRLGLTENVKLLGFRKDVYNVIAAADCLVHCPIEDDPLPTVVLEAMALQTPVIGSIIGGIPEEIENRETGLLVEPGKHLELSEAIKQILTNSQEAEQLARAGRCKFEAEFSHHLFVNRFEAIYTKLFS